MSVNIFLNIDYSFEVVRDGQRSESVMKGRSGIKTKIWPRRCEWHDLYVRMRVDLW